MLDPGTPPMPRRLRSASALVALVVVTGAGLAACGSGDGAAASGSLTVVDVTVDRPINPAQTAVRLVVDNAAARADVLESVTSPAADHVSVHRSTTDERGLSTMEDVDGLAIPARSKVTFAPGGLHVMLEDLTGDLAVGDRIPLTFTFAEAGTVAVEGTVTEPGAPAEEHDHD